ncbi:9729_t:CDS:1, partial [Cetraspora pellucida]
MISLPDHMQVGPNIWYLINSVYPNIEHGILNDDYLRDRMILFARNDDVQDINYAVLDMFPGDD